MWGPSHTCVRTYMDITSKALGVLPLEFENLPFVRVENFTEGENETIYIPRNTLTP